jgi:hypothetical protein
MTDKTRTGIANTISGIVIVVNTVMLAVLLVISVSWIVKK